MTKLQLIATTAFGLEAVVSRELKQLGYEDQQVSDGRVTFAGDLAAIARTNLWLRSAERVLIELGRFRATDFGELFDRTRALPWSEWLPVDAAFPVQGRSVRSQLHSVPHCQSIVKKAVVESLKSSYGRAWFDESGPRYTLEVSLLKDEATLTIDTTGVGLHKRGYRTRAGAAPLKETLAAALVQLSFWQPGRPLVDPCCGSGTIPIEAALIGGNRAPGLNRVFAAESWPQIAEAVWEQARREARDVQHPAIEPIIIGTDVEAGALRAARRHAEQAGVAGDIHWQQRPLADLSSSRSYGCVICNPPYGQRLSDDREVESLYREMAGVFGRLETWSFYVLTAYPEFEAAFGRQADRRRKLYNGRIECTYYQFHGPRPPRRRPAADTIPEDAPADNA